MSRLRLRKPWKIIGLPFNILGSLFAWMVFDVSWKEAWTGELNEENNA